MAAIQGGATYRIINARSGTALDISAADNRSVVGWTPHDGANQRWTLEWTGRSWFLRSVSSGMYLALAGPPGDGVPLIASQNPQEWHIWKDNADATAFRVFVPYTFCNIDLSYYGDATPGTRVQLWRSWEGIHQTWRFEQQG